EAGWGGWRRGGGGGGKRAVGADAGPSCRPALRLRMPVGAVRVRVPPVALAEPAWRLSVFRLPPDAKVSDPADVLSRSFAPPASVPPKVKPPVPVPPTVVVADRVVAADRTMLPAPSTATFGSAPAKLSGLPASVTVPAVLFTVKALRSKGVPEASMLLVAVYVAVCVAALPNVSVVAAPGVGAVPSSQFEPSDQLPPAGFFQVNW